MVSRLRFSRNAVITTLIFSSAVIAVYIIALETDVKKHLQSVFLPVDEISTVADEEVCVASPIYNDTSDFNMFDIYRDFVAHKARIENPKPRNLTKLKVFVVPFSHADPGWLKTFDAYTQDTNSVLDNMHRFLSAHPNMTFTWTEMAFFERWWSKQNSTTRDTIRSFVKSGRLEISSGSWVMTDEATVYYPLSVDNIVEGHELLREAFGNITPKVMWSCDPFGYSNSIPYLFTQAGMKHGIISRVHHEIKVYLQKKFATPFRWRQYFDPNGDSEMLTNVLPFAHYDFMEACGPNQAICCQFDFKRLNHYNCPGPRPVHTNPSNEVERAHLLMSQLYGMGERYETNVLLLVLGDDFRYAEMEEWHQQHDNFLPLFEVINREGLAEIHFATFSDYFNALEEWYRDNGKKPATLSGDFFPYRCHSGDLWTGYYTTRPFPKRQERATHNIVRAADLMVAQARVKMNATLASDLHHRLRIARQTLSLFQHHDAITGTSKVHVMEDYSKLLHNASNLARSAFEEAASALAGEKVYALEYSSNHNETETIATIKLKEGESIVINVYNSLPYNLQDVVSLRVNSFHVAVSNANGEVESQIEPYIHKGTISKDTFLLSFQCALLALSTSSFVLKSGGNTRLATVTTVHAVNNIGNATLIADLPSVFKVQSINAEDFCLENEQLKTSHDTTTGLLTRVTTTSTVRTNVATNFYAYRNSYGGAYTMRTSEAPEIYISEAVPRFFTRGPIQDTAHLFFGQKIYHKILLKKVEGSLGQQVNLFMRVDIRKDQDTELLLRIETNLNSPKFFADSAGLQLLRRQRFDSLSDSENFYPMPSATVLEDDHKRITVASNVPHGVSPLERGMDIVLDRMMNQDDGKGLGSDPDSLPIDMLPVEMRFSILVENIDNTESPIHSTYHTLAGHISVQNVIYPPVITFGSAQVPPLQKQAALPCNFQLLTVRAVANEKSLLTIYNSGSICHANTSTACTGDFKNGLMSYLRALEVTKVQETNLAGTVASREIPLDTYVPSVEPIREMRKEQEKFKFKAPINFQKNN